MVNTTKPYLLIASMLIESLSDQTQIQNSVQHHGLVEIICKRNAIILPYDCATEFIQDAVPSRYPSTQYPLAPVEHKIMEEYISKTHTHGHNRSSKPPAATAFIFVWINFCLETIFFFREIKL